MASIKSLGSKSHPFYQVFDSDGEIYREVESKREALKVKHAIEREDKAWAKAEKRRNPVKRPKSKPLSKRVPAALTKWLKKLNPSKMRLVSRVRVKKLKGGGVTITPAR